MDKEMDEAATELALFIENDYPAYTDLLYSVRNLRKHYRRGDYDPVRAVDGLLHPVSRGARRYVSVWGSSGDMWFRLFVPEVRRSVASHFVDVYAGDVTDDESNWLDKEK
jgi:hypothetical protein